MVHIVTHRVNFGTSDLLLEWAGTAIGVFSPRWPNGGSSTRNTSADENI